MKSGLILTAILFISMSIPAQTTFIQTNIGKIAIKKTERASDQLPVILLHGVYFDHHLWDEQVKHIDDRTVVTIDMPLHGESREITKPDWSLSDCAVMLVEILDSLKITKVIAIGHSWGSMTILRAASIHPERFEGICLCNMPFEAASPKQKRLFNLQHTLLFFRKFYTKQAAKSLFGKSSLKVNPQFHHQLQRPMNMLTIGDIKQIDKKVILDAEDATTMILSLKVKAIALKGKEDYVPTPPKIQTILVDGGHISPLEEPVKVLDLIRTLIYNNKQ
jgi:pimeloyl-ACP methyl ester carboxylesterase